MVHAQGLQAPVADGPPRRIHRNDREPKEKGLAERKPSLAVVVVHERERTSLNFGDPTVEVVGAGASTGDGVSADVSVGLDKYSHGLSDFCRLGLHRRHHVMALV